MNEHLARWVYRPAAAVGGVVLVAVMLLTVLDVGLRHVLNAPLPGTFELTELAMVGIVFLGLGQAQHLGEQITIDLLYDQVPSPARLALDVLAGAASLLLALLITWQLLVHLGRIQASREVTAVLAFPVYPAVGVAVVGFGLFALALLADLIGVLRRRTHSVSAQSAEVDDRGT